MLQAIAHGSDAAGVVLLCFEKLAEKPCHRRLFAGWWEDKTGQPVPELCP